VGQLYDLCRRSADSGSKKPTHLTAPAYVEALMTWTQSILDDEKHFPQKIGMSSCLAA